MKNIWISGSINSGKSTVAKILSKELKMPAIELDAFSDFSRQFMEFKDCIALNYDMATEIAGMYNRKGYGVIIVYPIDEKKNSYLKEYCSDFTFFTIDPGIEIASTDRGGRKLNDWEKEKVVRHYENRVNDLSFGIRIDSKNLTPEQTADKIIEYLNKKT